MRIEFTDFNDFVRQMKELDATHTKDPRSCQEKIEDFMKIMVEFYKCDNCIPMHLGMKIARIGQVQASQELNKCGVFAAHTTRKEKTLPDGRPISHKILNWYKTFDNPKYPEFFALLDFEIVS